MAFPPELDDFLDRCAQERDFDFEAVSAYFIENASDFIRHPYADEPDSSVKARAQDLFSAVSLREHWESRNGTWEVVPQYGTSQAENWMLLPAISYPPCSKSVLARESKAKTAYLPKTKHGTRLLEHRRPGLWQVVSKPDMRVAYRNTKNFDDVMIGAPASNAGEVIEGVDEEDGWIRCSVEVFAIGDRLLSTRDVCYSGAQPFTVPSMSLGTVVTLKPEPVVVWDNFLRMGEKAVSRAGIKKEEKDGGFSDDEFEHWRVEFCVAAPHYDWNKDAVGGKGLCANVSSKVATSGREEAGSPVVISANFEDLF